MKLNGYQIVNELASGKYLKSISKLRDLYRKGYITAMQFQHRANQVYDMYDRPETIVPKFKPIVKDFVNKRKTFAR